MRKQNLMLMKTVLSCIFLACISVIFVKIYFWKNPVGNKIELSRSMYKCIYEDPNHKELFLDSIGNKFKVAFVQNSNIDCVNPFFPSINIKLLSNNHNAWIHIIRTDSQESQLVEFIDNDPNFAPLPFYNFNNEFYDAPLWSYTIFNKPVSFWEGHVYAVNFNDKNKIIECLGGIGWGFRLSYLHLYPQIIKPYDLFLKDWTEDWKLINKFLIGYKDVSLKTKIAP